MNYDFTQLGGWREQIANIGDAGITSYGISERLNRVKVSVANAGDIAPLAGRLVTLGIPTNAFEIEVRPAVQPRGSSLSVAYTNPFGGVRVTSNAEAPGYGCTLGFNAYDQNGTRIFVTNSHCTAATLGPDAVASTFHQASLTDRIIGTEYKDPAGLFGNGTNGCPSTYVCRSSDAAEIAYSAGVAGKWSRIAETASGSFWTGGYKRIIGIASLPMVGEWVSWVGATSGTVTGQVYSAATGLTYTLRGVNIDIQNSIEIGGNSLGGDSGAPVYFNPGPIRADLAYLSGILFAGYAGFSYYSPIGRITADLGFMTVFGTTVGLSGPTFIGANGNYTWTADAQGSSGYSYQWEISNDGVNWSTTCNCNTSTVSQLWTTVGPGFHYEFYLRVTATGSAGGNGQSDLSDPIHVIVQG